jgi:PIN domain nuclease of toxin-antitoxin system
VFLLDTHVWLWIVEGHSRHIGRRTARLVERWAERDALRISPLSVFEVAQLYASGRLRLSRTLEQWMTAARETVGGRLALLTTDAAIDAGTMGGALVPDPIDRLLIATARQSNATFVTADRRIVDYAAATSAVRVHDARR